MYKLHSAFVRGKEIKAYTFTAWNEITSHRRLEKATQQAWSDYHAEALAILLAGIPQQADNKVRMDAILEMADQMTELHFS